jgi:hypothetical protein
MLLLMEMMNCVADVLVWLEILMQLAVWFVMLNQQCY